MTTPNPFDGLEGTPISESSRKAIDAADEVMSAANLPTYTDLLEGIEKLIRRTSPGMPPVTIDWLHEHITPLRPK